MEAYFDNNATTRMDERVLEAMLPFFKKIFRSIRWLPQHLL